ncbi:MAG TPA: ferritin-like domain-containing protein [bacterium]|nr:ferritin-like domain-containing protein [bacterium]
MAELLAEARRREKTRTRVYRSLAAAAEDAADSAASERLNGLHADEQHHLSRLTARLLELGGTPENLPGGLMPDLRLHDWEARARAAEEGEIAFYETFLGEPFVDEATRRILEEILASERLHLEHLGGKWMPA